MKNLLKQASLLTAAALFAVPVLAYTPLTLTDVSDKDTNNPEDVQCVMYGNSCPAGQQDMDVLNYAQKGSETEWKLEATPNQDANKDGLTNPYTVGYLAQFVGEVFGVGIDVNTASGASTAEVLQFFEVYVAGNLAFAYYGPGSLDPAFNGNGFFDFTLTTIDLTSFNDTDTVVFKTHVTSQTDGAENFFLYRLGGCEINCGPEAAEPASLALIGLALAGFGLARRRRK